MLPLVARVTMPRSAGSSIVSVRASASRVAVTPSGSVARCLPWPSGELVQHRHAERLEALLEHVLDRLRPRPLGPLLAPVAVAPCRRLRRRRRRRACPPASSCTRNPSTYQAGRVDVLEEEDAAVEVDLPRRAHRLHEQPEAAADERRRDAAPRRSPARTGRPGLAAPRRSSSPARTSRRRALAERRRRPCRRRPCKPVAVERREARPLAQRDVCSAVMSREADERLRVRGDEVEVEVGDELGRAVAALHALDDVDLGVGEHRHQVARRGSSRRRRRSRRGRRRRRRASRGSPATPTTRRRGGPPSG